MDPTNRRTAMRELERGRELMAKLSTSLLEVTSSRANDDHDRSELVGVFYERVMRAFDVSISLVKSVDATAPVGSPVSVLQRDGAHRNGSVTRTGSGDPNPRSQTRRRVSYSKTTVTDSPFGDGYQWRKYGQKIIRNVKHPRSYYKCSHTGCSAKLQVQQTADSSNLPLYEVIRNNEHTCSTDVGLLYAVQDSSSSPPRGAHIITFESGEPVAGFGGGPTLSQPALSATAATGVRDDDCSVFSPPLSPVGPFYGVDATYYL